MSGVPGDKCKVPRAFWRAVERLGLPASAVLRQARLPATLHLNEQAFVTTTQYFALWRALEELYAKPALGIRLVEVADTAIHPPSTLAAFHARNYREGIARIRYGATRDLLVLRSADLDRPFPGHNPELLDILTPALAAALGELSAQSSLSEQVTVVLKRSLASGRPELSDIARELGMSERTLQRRITEEGTSFRELLINARQELGRQLLLDPTADIDEVACLLGYQDASSFYRAFREWEGTTPNRWRELNFDSSKPAVPGSFLQ
ncbi:MAG: helix-turn-helix domain-containing protein [Mesorhizobium sp.]|nr:MAG: helix-turn-helix domain-containing protein [Mesorhizobium sp.]